MQAQVIRELYLPEAKEMVKTDLYPFAISQQDQCAVKCCFVQVHVYQLTPTTSWCDITVNSKGLFPYK